MIKPIWTIYKEDQYQIKRGASSNEITLILGLDEPTFI